MISVSAPRPSQHGGLNASRVVGATRERERERDAPTGPAKLTDSAETVPERRAITSGGVGL